jgi:tRNA (guanine37-N1)-methyltransferase
MKIDIVTLFPEFFEVAFSFGPIKRCIELKNFEINIHNLRDFADGPKEVDDYQYGGGAGMVLKIEPLVRSLRKLKKENSMVILFEASGIRLNQKIVNELSKKEHLILYCGRYKGVDERFKNYIDMEISIGDYVLSGGEGACFVFIDAISRLLPGALSDFDSAEGDSFFSGILGYPVYTRPREFEGYKVPDVLLSGNHKEIERFRKKEALKKTLLRRPDLLENLNEEEIKILEEIKKEVESGASKDI